MSTLNFNKKHVVDDPPVWTCRINESEYHRAARAGEVISSSMLKEFRRCPAFYHVIVSGIENTVARDVFRFGRAAHKFILEGEEAFRSAFAVGGPVNRKTGAPYAHASRAFGAWAEAFGLDPACVLTPAELAALGRMCAAVLAHCEASRLLASGWAELSVRADVGGLPCQARLDWLCADGVAVDLKTTADIARFEGDARRFGYLHQFAFYREVALAAGAGEVEFAAIVVEKRAPFRAGVWRFPEAVLAPYAAQNASAMAALRRCHETRRWPTGYEGARAFPPVGLPPVWLN